MQSRLQPGSKHDTPAVRRHCSELGASADSAPTPSTPRRVAMRVLVTGAGGRIGTRVTARLSQAGHVVRAFALPSDAAMLTGVAEVHLGDATSPPSVREALEGVDAVVHLATIPAPMDEPVHIFTNNVTATFILLEMAAQASVTRAIIASSMSALGLSWAPDFRSPYYVPVDEEHPLRPEDCYSLGKQVDEATAAMMARRHGMTVLAYRFPYTTNVEEITARSAEIERDPEEAERAAKALWGYLDVLDAAEAVLAGLESSVSGFQVINVVAPESLAAAPTANLLARYHPSAELRTTFQGRQGLYTTDRAAELIGFTATRLISAALDHKDGS